MEGEFGTWFFYLLLRAPNVKAAIVIATCPRGVSVMTFQDKEWGSGGGGGGRGDRDGEHM